MEAEFSDRDALCDAIVAVIANTLEQPRKD
jgi:hypothetical protein